MPEAAPEFSDLHSVADAQPLAAADDAAEPNVSSDSCDDCANGASTSSGLSADEIVAECVESEPVAAEGAAALEDDEVLARVMKESEEDALRDEARRKEAEAREAEEAEEAIRLSTEEARAAEAEALARAEADLIAALEASKEISCVPELKAEADFQTAIQMSKVESHALTQAPEFLVEWATPSKCQKASGELDLSMDPSLLIFGAAGKLYSAGASGSGSSGETSRGF